MQYILLIYYRMQILVQETGNSLIRQKDFGQTKNERGHSEIMLCLFLQEMELMKHREQF